MLNLLFFAVCFLCSIIGSICGVGGGIIIKPVLDATGIMSVSAISFLSGCTVLAMSTVSVIRKRDQKSLLDLKICLPLALGATAGGILGKAVFDIIKAAVHNENALGGIQAAILLVITIGSLIYTIKSSRIKGHYVENIFACVVIGLLLGAISSFLGIGGGPINLTVLSFFFSMDTKKAAANSLYIIMFSQIASLLQTLIIGSVPVFSIVTLVVIVVAGVLGGILGSSIHRRIHERSVNKLFIGFMAVVIVVNIYNLLKFNGIAF